jgi:alkanesulfonate monooxygenase SsuD/methylene tetrahydromethanopterin reductase-like flavin-dependent oxidoreductase (luciferase family)
MENADMTQRRHDQMLLVAFLQASNCSNYPASWRHPATEMRFLTPNYYQHIARTLEAGKFHLAFVDDRLAMPSQYGESFVEAVQHGIRAVKLDLVPVVTAMAHDKLAYIESLAQPIDALVLLSEVLNYDFARHALDDSLSEADLAAMSGIRSFVDRVVQLSGKANPTVRDFLQYTGRGTLRELPRFVGPPAQVVDQMAAWFFGQACDGFVIAATHMPGAYEDVVRLVVPELQRRGLFHTVYAGGMLRENLGLPCPQPLASAREATSPLQADP